jgi:hypothetical protein
MSHKQNPKCTHPWHHFGPDVCPGCKDTARTKMMAGMPEKDRRKQGLIQ